MLTRFPTTPAFYDIGKWRLLPAEKSSYELGSLNDVAQHTDVTEVWVYCLAWLLQTSSARRASRSHSSITPAKSVRIKILPRSGVPRTASLGGKIYASTTYPHSFIYATAFKGSGKQLVSRYEDSLNEA